MTAMWQSEMLVNRSRVRFVSGGMMARAGVLEEKNTVYNMQISKRLFTLMIWHFALLFSKPNNPCLPGTPHPPKSFLPMLSAYLSLLKTSPYRIFFHTYVASKNLYERKNVSIGTVFSRHNKELNKNGRHCSLGPSWWQELIVYFILIPKSFSLPYADYSWQIGDILCSTDSKAIVAM